MEINSNIKFVDISISNYHYNLVCTLYKAVYKQNLEILTQIVYANICI